MLTLKQKNQMKRWIEQASDDISIVCIASCPICDQEFDAEDKDDDMAVQHIIIHMELTHTYNQLKEYHAL